jgi:salicylate hydroxylase
VFFVFPFEKKSKETKKNAQNALQPRSVSFPRREYLDFSLKQPVRIAFIHSFRPHLILDASKKSTFYQPYEKSTFCRPNSITKLVNPKSMLSSVGICGAGPAGLATALLLSRFVPRVVVMERFATPQPVGSGLLLQESGLRVLRSLQLEEAVKARSQRIDRLFGTHKSRVALDVRYLADAPAFGTHRAVLHDVLFRAVSSAKNVSIVPSFDVERVDADSGVVLARDGRVSEPFNLVVDALGARSPIAASVDPTAQWSPLQFGAIWTNLVLDDALDVERAFPANRLTQSYRRAQQMVGVIPLGRPLVGGDTRRHMALFWSVKVGERPTDLAALKRDIVALMPDLEPLLEQITSLDQFTFAPYAHRTMQRASDGRLIAFVGDSLKSTSPQLGQGATTSLVDAAALAQCLEGWKDDVPRALQLFGGARRRHIQFYQGLSYLLTPFYQSESRVLPIIRDVVALPMATVPWTRVLLARLISGTLVDPICKRGQLNAKRERAAQASS